MLKYDKHFEISTADGLLRWQHYDAAKCQKLQRSRICEAWWNRQEELQQVRIRRGHPANADALRIWSPHKFAGSFGTDVSALHCKCPFRMKTAIEMNREQWSIWRWPSHTIKKEIKQWLNNMQNGFSAVCHLYTICHSRQLLSTLALMNILKAFTIDDVLISMWRQPDQKYSAMSA